MSKRELKSLTGNSSISISGDKGRMLRSAGHVSKSSKEVPGMSVEELNARVKELEGELEKAHQTARDKAQELEASCHAAEAATATMESLRKQDDKLSVKCDDLNLWETTA